MDDPELEPWDDGTPEREDGRPSELVLAVRLLAASAALKAFQILEIVFTHGDRVSHPAALVDIGGFVIWILLIVFLWRGNAFARTLVLVATAWDMIGAFSAASIVYAIGGSQTSRVVTVAERGHRVRRGMPAPASGVPRVVSQAMTPATLK